MIIVLLALAVICFTLYKLSRRLTVAIHQVESEKTFKIIFISDLHLGFWKRADWLQKTVSQIHQQKEVDFVLVGGDWLYWAKTEDIETLLAPLGQVKIPIYGVLGNHDYDAEYMRSTKKAHLEKLTTTLQKLGVILLDNDETILTLRGQKLRIIGFGDHENNHFVRLSVRPPVKETLFARHPRAKTRGFDPLTREIPQQVREDGTKHYNFTIALMHNPDTVLTMNKDESYDLMLAGHTHNGQIAIPWLERLWLPITGPYVGGWYKTQHGPLFVTNGIGEAGLPIRYKSLSTIDVLLLRSQRSSPDDPR